MENDMKVQRSDSLPLDATYFTDEGYLVDHPIVTSVGIFVYHNPDGSERRELRLPEEVFAEKSLASYKGKPIIVTHDAGYVDTDNVKEESIGTILSEGYRDGDDVRAEIIIHDTDSLKKYKMRELSCGYNLRLDETPGVWEGQPYDAIQRDIEINHLALVDKARAGEQARLNIDGQGHDCMKGEKLNMENTTKRTDGAPTPEELAAAVEAFKKRRAERSGAAADGGITAEPLRIAGLKGPTTMGLVNLLSMEQAGTAAMDYDLQLYGAADEIVPLLIKGELDMAAIPANLAATLYQKTNGGIQAVAVNTLGVLYVVEQGDTVHSMADLKGRTILSTGKGTTPEYVLRYLLTANGLDPDKDVDIQYYSEATEVTAQMASTQDAIAVLPQPYVTAAGLKDDTLRVALDLTAEWDKVADTQLITGVTVVRKAYAEEHPDVVAAFLADYAQSVNAANTDLDGTAALCEEQGVVAKAAIAKKALPNCNIVCLTGEELKADVSGYLQVLYDADPAAVGGTLPGEDFYWTAQ